MDKKIECDWIIHGVLDGKNDRIVYHTHGLSEFHDMIELELNLPIEQNQAKEFINFMAVYLIRNGLKIKENTKIEGAFTCPIYLKRVKGIFGDGEENLRIIFPDEKFRFPWEEGCSERYSKQI